MYLLDGSVSPDPSSGEEINNAANNKMNEAAERGCACSAVLIAPSFTRPLTTHPGVLVQPPDTCRLIHYNITAMYNTVAAGRVSQ